MRDTAPNTHNGREKLKMMQPCLAEGLALHADAYADEKPLN